nr:MAG TPA: hypothetical protein [Caudoviricetes sp.]
MRIIDIFEIPISLKNCFNYSRSLLRVVENVTF